MVETSSSPWILHPIASGEPVHLEPGVTTVGRSAACGIKVVQTMKPTSRMHCQFEVNPENMNLIKIKDLGSTNGVFVNNNQRRGVIDLNEGDRIGIGCDASDQICQRNGLPVYILRKRPDPNNLIKTEDEVPIINLESDDESEYETKEGPSCSTKVLVQIENQPNKLQEGCTGNDKKLVEEKLQNGKSGEKQHDKEKDTSKECNEVYEISDDDDHNDDEDDENMNLELSQCMIREIKQEFVDLEEESFNSSGVEGNLDKEVKVENICEYEEKQPASPLFSMDGDENGLDDDGDESLSIWINKLSQSLCNEKSPPKPKSLKRSNPEIIQPPNLPTKKGKHRGVSAISPAKPGLIDENKINKVVEKLKARDRGTSAENELKQKWLQKPNLMKRKEEEKKRKILDERKQKLKELADKQASKRQSLDDDVKIVKKPKVKVTERNRGAFLVENIDGTSSNKAQKEISEPKVKERITRSSVTQTKEYHNKELRQSKNQVLSSEENIKPHAASKEINKRKSILKSNYSTSLKKRQHVKFNDNIQIKTFEIDNCNATLRKVDSKDAPMDFKPFIEKCRQNDRRKRLILEDHSEEIISEILSWDPEWINAGMEIERIGKNLLPMMSNFQNLNDFQRAIFPLMKLELWALIERELDRKENVPFVTATVAGYCKETNSFDERFILYSDIPLNLNQNRDFILNHGDLCILKFGSSNDCTKLFAFVKSMRKTTMQGKPQMNLAFDLHYDTKYTKLLESSKSMSVRVITQIRVELGAFNAVYNLKLSPLRDKILSPFENKSKKNYCTDKIRYKGYDALNENQKTILLKTYLQSIDENNSNICLIEGPPGTGKSRVIANLVLQMLYGEEVKVLNKKILVCSQSNTAIDVIAVKLLQIRSRMKRDKFNLVRFGILDKINAAVQCISIQKLIAKSNANRSISDIHNLRAEKKIIECKIAALECGSLENNIAQDEMQKLKQRRTFIDNLINQQPPPELERNLNQSFLQGAHIVCTTLSSCIKILQYVRYFDCCIIDEATQCLEPWTLIPLQFNVKSLVLVGDTQQLPATILSQISGKYGFEVSLFTRIQKCLEISAKHDIYTLKTQYRMHPEICRWPNSYFYKNVLVNDKSTVDMKCPLKPYVVLSLRYDQNNQDNNRGKIFNELEAKFIVNLIKSMSELLPTERYSYGVITPYSEHRDYLAKDIADAGIKSILVNTIDSYQGKEKDVIIISNARTRGIGFLSNCQRLNVALTRARKSLILCGNFLNVERIPVWKSLLDNARNRGFYYEIGKSDVNDFNNKVMCHIRAPSKS